MFGENTEVPLSAIVTHRDGQALLGAPHNASSQIPDGADPADVTDLAEPFEIPKIGLNRPPEDHAAFHGSDEDEEEARPIKRCNTHVVAEDGTAVQADGDGHGGSGWFCNSGSDDNTE